MKCKREKLMILSSVLMFGMAAAVAEAEMVGLWEFDFGIANDSCGNHGGKLVGNPNWEDGRVGGALLFDGDDYVMLPRESDFDFSNAMTVACWIRVTAFDQQRQPIVSKGSWNLTRVRNGNAVAFQCWGVRPNDRKAGNNRGVQGSVNVNDAKWHHVAGVYDGSQMNLYVDGVLDKSLEASGTINNSKHQVCIGRNARMDIPARNFKGLIDDVAIFDRALSKDEVVRLYETGGASFIPSGHMARLVEEAEAAVKKLEHRDSVAFLEKKIAEHKQWKAKNKGSFGPRDGQMSSDVYFLLARAKEAAGLPKEDVVAAYKQAVSRVRYRTKHVPDALLWLFENIPADDYVNVVTQFFRRTNVGSYNIHLVTKHFEANDNWDAFNLFLDGAFSTVGSGPRAFLYAKVTGKSLKQNGAWAVKFEEYCRAELELTTYVFRKQEEDARKYIAQQNFGKAVEIYRDIVSRCGPNQRKTAYEFNVCECLFNAGQFESAIREIDSFVKDNKATNKQLVPRAIMLEGQAYVHLGDIDRATDTFFTLMVEYPGATQGPDANFFIGYCYMLQGKFDEATEAFDLVIKDYPESSYVDKARSYLTRIKDMTE